MSGKSHHMNEMHEFTLNELKNEIKLHGIKSGEIIIELNPIKDVNASIDNLINTFFFDNNILPEHRDFSINEILLKEAVISIIYGLSKKPNYTLIDIEFTSTEKNKIAYTFISLFSDPKFYSLNTRIYREPLNLEDFWETGGAIVVDDKMIGIIWINDLYDKF